MAALPRSGLTGPDLPPDDRRPDDAPATLGDVRTLRRWLWVAGTWAAAASIIAIIALFTGGDSDDGDSASTQGDIAELEQNLTGRIDNLEQQVDEAAMAEDLQRVTDRVEELEQQLEETDTQAGDQDLDELRQQLSDLDRRVEELEAGPPADQESP